MRTISDARTHGISVTGLQTRGCWLLAVCTAVLGLLMVPSASLAAPDLQVSLRSSDTEWQMLHQHNLNSGTYRLRFGQGGPGVGETADIPADASALVVQGALNAITNISQGGGSVSIVGEAGTADGVREYAIRFDGGPLAGTDVPLLSVDYGGIESPLPRPISVRTVRRPEMRRDDERIEYYVSVRNAAAPASSPSVGDQLFCNGIETSLNEPKQWFPGQPGDANFPTFGFEWRRNGAVIAGEAQQTYTAGLADAGAVIQCVVTGTNANASSAHSSRPVVVDPQPAGPPPLAPDAPLSGTRPVVTGTGAVGNQRTCAKPAAWPTDTPATFQWLINATPIAGATSATYIPVAADNGKNLQCMAIGTNAGGSVVSISNNNAVGTVTQPPNLTEAQTPDVNFNDNATTGPITLEIELPEGLDTSALDLYDPASRGQREDPEGWVCSSTFATVSDSAKVTCTRSDSLAPQAQFPAVGVGIALGAGTSTTPSVRATVSGGGDPDGVMVSDAFDFSLPSLGFGLIQESMVTGLFDENSEEDTRAGAHPWAADARVQTTHRRWRSGSNQGAAPADEVGLVEHIKQVRTDPPAGLVGNPLAPQVVCDDPKKTLEQVDTANGCPRESVVGWLTTGAQSMGFEYGPALLRFPLYAVKSERGELAQFAFGEPETKGIYVVNARLRPEEGYAVTVDSAPISEQIPWDMLGATLCSYGVAIGSDGRQPAGCFKPGQPGAFSKPFLTNPTSCPVESPVTRMSADSWEHPGVFSTVSVEEPSMEGCDQVPFTPSVAMSPTSQTAGGAAGLDASISIPVDGFEDPNGVSQSHLKKTVVELPAGVSVNPSAATGLEGCTDAQLGLGTDSEPSCPDGSKLGVVEATTPVLEETLDGVMVLRTPKSTDPASGEMLRLALIVRNDERGLLVKLPGSAVADPQTGRLTATFDNNPQLPIGTVDVVLKGGSRGVLAMPQDCGQVETKATLTPWSGNADAVSNTPSQVDEGCGGGFAPELAAGSSDNRARGQGGTYSFKFSREDGEQWLRGLTAKLPKGLLASVKDVPLCSNGLADAGNCPASSKIGVVDAKAGAGDPFVLEEKGEVFLTEGYKGGEYGLAVKVRPVAGPFRGEYELSPIVVRQAIHVDRSTAEVTAVSDPFPLIHHGIPLRVREVNVLVNRGGFMVNPSDCTQKQSSATLVSDRGASAGFSDPFQVSGCADLPFKPKLTLALTGRRQVTTGKHPGIKAKVTQQGTSEAGIEKAVVRLPKSLALDPENAQALCEFADGTKPDLENRCPKGSIVGRARASTPLLEDDLAGNVYFVKNVRKDPVTGNEIRTLPMIVVALRGEIAINLKGESSTTRAGKLVNTFASVPDAPISQFNLNIKGGKTGIIAVTRTRRSKINLCTGRHIAENDMDGHNGRQHDADVRMKTPCTKRQTKAAKLRAKRAAAKARS